MTVRSRTTVTGVALLAGIGLITAGCGGTAAPVGDVAPFTSQAAPVSSATTGSAGTTGAGSHAASAGSTAAESVTSPGAPRSSAAPVTETNPVGDIPATQAFVEYTPTSGGYAVKVPEGWARTDTTTPAGGSAALFSDKYNSIRIDTAVAAAAPTVQSGHAELTGIASTVTGFTPGKVTVEQRQAGPAVLVTYRADSAPNAVTGKVVSQDVQRYEFFRNGKQVNLTLSAPVGSDNVDPWRTVTDSLRWTA